MRTVHLPITSCQQCPNLKKTNQWSSDGWDRMEDWVCIKVNDRKIAGSVEWHEEKKIRIPSWCPYGNPSEDYENVGEGI